MAVKTDNQVKLSDGRSIGYAEYGDLAGRPVLYLSSGHPWRPATDGKTEQARPWRFELARAIE